MISLELGYLALLVLLALGYYHFAWLHNLVHDPAAPIPLAVPWWGALGGITISLTGLFRHASTWDGSYQGWHIARPFVGAVIGTVGYLIFIVVIRTTGAHVPAGSGSGQAVFDLVAFLVGYREAVFRDLLRKAVDVLLAPGRPSDKSERGTD